MLNEVHPQIVVKEDQDTVTLSLAGDINAQFAWPAVPNAAGKKIMINLNGVQYINSVGVKNWIRTYPFLGKKVELYEVNVHMMDSFNMTPAMQFDCKIKSFYLPVYCQKCEEKFELISADDVNFSDDPKIQLKPCSCGLMPEIDTDVDMYLTCIDMSTRSAS